MDKKDHKPMKTLFYSKVRKQNKNQTIITIEQNSTVTIKILFIFKFLKFVVFVIKTLILIFKTTIIVVK